MFSKLAQQYQSIGDNPCKGSWFDEEKEVKPLVDIDCSSIIGSNKQVDLPVESAFRPAHTKEIDLTYGLDEIRKKYENMSPLKGSSKGSVDTTASQKSKSTLGHKRNPTENLPRRGVYELYTNDAPGSAQNLPVTSPKSRRKNKSRQSRDEPYQLNFTKKKKNLKENNPKESREVREGRSKARTLRVSKSRSREKGLRSIRGNVSPH